jgi:hypothetical protein
MTAVSVEERWPGGQWLPLGRLIVDPGLYEPPPPLGPAATRSLRGAPIQAWTPVLVIGRGRDLVILDGSVRRAREARRRGATHVYGFVGTTDESVLAQLQAHGLPITARTLAMWSKGVTKVALERFRRYWEVLHRG